MTDNAPTEESRPAPDLLDAARDALAVLNVVAEDGRLEAHEVACVDALRDAIARAGA